MKGIVYDIYLMDLNGTAIFCGCTGTAYCQRHVGQHELHTGFFSAIYGFSKEAFQESALDGVLMGSVQLNFKVDTQNQLLLALVHPGNIKRRIIRRQLNKIMDIYLAKYKEKVQPHVVDDALYSAFMTEIFAAGILPTPKVIPVEKLQMNQEKLVEKVTSIIQGG